MNTIERRILQRQGLCYLENLDKWRRVKNLAETLNVGLALYRSNSDYSCYCLYQNPNEPRPTTSRNNRITFSQNALSNTEAENSVFDLILNNLNNAFMRNLAVKKPKKETETKAKAKAKAKVKAKREEQAKEAKEAKEEFEKSELNELIG